MLARFTLSGHYDSVDPVSSNYPTFVPTDREEFRDPIKMEMLDWITTGTGRLVVRLLLTKKIGSAAHGGRAHRIQSQATSSLRRSPESTTTDRELRSHRHRTSEFAPRNCSR